MNDMHDELTLSIRLSPAEAQAYLTWLTSQYEQLMADLWYQDRYRYVPDGFRARRILADFPHVAGLNRSVRGLVKQLNLRSVGGDA